MPDLMAPEGRITRTPGFASGKIGDRLYFRKGAHSSRSFWIVGGATDFMNRALNVED